MTKKIGTITVTVICTLAVVFVASRLFGNNFVLGTGFQTAGSFLPLGLMLLICPLMHLFMMPLMHGKHGKSDGSSQDQDQKKPSCH